MRVPCFGAPGRAVRAAMVLAILAQGMAVRADRRDFAFTYDWMQPARSEKEIALHLDYAARSGLWKQELEGEVGITERWSIAPYLVFEGGGGRGDRLEAVKVEVRRQLGAFAANRLLPGLYLELEKPMEEPAEAELRLIASMYDGQGGDVSLNVTASGPLGRSAPWNHGYSIAAVRPVRGGAKAGLEWQHDLSASQMLLGPTLAGPVGEAWGVLGYAFPVRGRGNSGHVRLIIQHQWF